MSDPQDKPLFEKPLEFGGIVIKEVQLPEGVLARVAVTDHGKVKFVDLTDGEFFKYWPRSKQ